MTWQRRAMENERAAVVREALSWLGTPWRHQGRIKGAGVDCGQLLLEVFSDAGVIPMFHVEPYVQDWHLHRDAERYLGQIERFGRRLPDGVRPLPGDVVLYKFGRCVSHGGIVVDWPTIVHAYNPLGVVLDDGDANVRLAKRQVGFWSPWTSAFATSIEVAKLEAEAG